VHAALGVIGMARRGGAAARGSTSRSSSRSRCRWRRWSRTRGSTQELRRSERFRKHVLDSMASALVAVNMQGEILTFNRAAEELLGFRRRTCWASRSARCSAPTARSCARDARARARGAARSRPAARARTAPRAGALTTSLLRNERRAVYGAIATFVDLTPLKRAEEHARRLDRLAALGRFTSSVAHEIRNPLTGIGAGIQYLARALDGERAQRENLEFILSEIQRLDASCRTCSTSRIRGGSSCARPVDGRVRRARAVPRALLDERGVTARRRRRAAHAARAARRRPDPAGVHQPDQERAEASPRAGTRASRAARAAPGARGGRHRRARDRRGSGQRDPAEHLKTIFEPFFTTKPEARARSLHQPRHRQAARRQPRRVERAGAGTTFVVELPLETHGGSMSKATSWSSTTRTRSALRDQGARGRRLHGPTAGSVREAARRSSRTCRTWRCST
jgi:PAS domain S-box-containing protein